MDSLLAKITCSLCHLPLANSPKVLPGCLHVFCVSCLNKLPIAFLTNPSSSNNTSCRETTYKRPQLPLGTEEEERRGFSCAEVDGWLAVYDNHTKSCSADDAAQSEAKDALLASLSLSGKSYESPNRRPRTVSHGTSDGTASMTSSDNFAGSIETKQASECGSLPSAMSTVILTVTCPKCRRPSLIPPEGFDHLRTSYVTANMAAAYKAVSELRSKVSGKTTCEQCMEETQATSYCVTCRQLICEDHTQWHRKWKELSSHKILPLDSLSVSDTGLVKLLSPSLNLGDFTCERHPAKGDGQCKFFCSTCEDLACSYCTISTHRDGTEHHSCISITPEVISEARSKVVGSAESLSTLMDDLDSFAGDIQTQCETISKKAHNAKDRIDAIFTEIIDTLQSRKLSLFDEVDALVSDPLKKLKVFEKKVDALKDHILDSKNFIQENLDHEGSLSLLSVAGVLSSHSSTVRREYNQLQARLNVEHPTIDFSDERDKLYDCIASFGNVRDCQSTPTGSSTSQNMNIMSPTMFSMCRNQTLTSTAKVSLYEHIQKLKTLTVTSGNPVAPILPPFESSTVDVFNPNLTDSLTGTYVYQPPLLPSPSDANPSPKMEDLPKFTGMYVRSLEGLFSPSGIRVDSEFRLVVCEFGTDQVTTFDQTGEEVSRVGQTGDDNGQFRFPQNVDFDREGKMIVVDSVYRVQMFDRNGRFLRSVGSKGKGRLQFMDPVSAAISPDKQVFVCERENHRIQVLNSDLSFKCFIGKPGRTECQFYLPGDIAISSDGYLYVADTGNHRIQVLTLDGTFVSSFGKKGSGQGELNQPSHLCVDEQAVYITEEKNNRVSVFTRSGHFVRTIGGKGEEPGKFRRPLGVAIDRNRTLYVCDSKNNRIQIFK